MSAGLVLLAACRTAGPAPVAGSQRVAIANGEWTLVGDLAMPVARGPVPVALLLNQAAGERTVYRPLAEALARHGIASLRLDLRGHGESVNRGRFVPSEGTEILAGSDTDVSAALAWLRADPRIDPGRMAVVGASYSGEAMMQAARTDGYVAAYAGLSPGSLSDGSIDAIDREELPFLLVVARHERYLKEVAQALRERSRTAEFLELSGTAHATELLGDHPELNERLALWLEQRLAASARR